MTNPTPVMPALHTTSVLIPVMPVPQTTYVDFLGPDKRPFTVPPGPSIPNEAISKSVRILKKFWGDEEDEDSDSGAQTDNTTRSNKYLEDKMVKVPTFKVGRPRKKNKNSKNNLDKSGEGIKTRSKAQPNSSNIY